MKNGAESTTKPNKLAQAQEEFARVVSDASQRGFFGTAGLSLSVQDGHIQHIKVSVERMIK